ncbi:MAG: YdeI/OmpD-associated family protein [Gemmatimonadales bacterium]
MTGIAFFKSPSAFRAWLTRHHRTARELHVGFYKRGSGKPSITWPESVDEALCFGWIDGVRHRLDDLRYTIRFTPRNPRSTWSAVNLKRVRRLIKAGRMQAAGLKLFKERDRKKSGLYSFEQRRRIKLAPRFAKLFKVKRAAWAYYRAQAPWYQRTAAFWVASAKKEDTRLKRLATLIAASARGRRIGPLVRPTGRASKRLAGRSASL